MRLSLRLLGCAQVFTLLIPAIPLAVAGMPFPVVATPAEMRERLLEFEPLFEANLGQAPERVKFLTRGKTYSTYLTPEEIVFRARQPGCAAAPGSDQAEWAIRLVNSSRNPIISGESRSQTVSHYFLGNDPARWLKDVSNFGRIRYAGVYPGTDLLFRHSGDHLEFDFVMSPEGNPSSILLEFHGVDDLEVTDEGDLVVSLRCEQFRLSKPRAFQESLADPVAAAFALKGERLVSIAVAEYDRARPLVIDPVLSYATYLAGSRGDAIRSVAVDPLGFAYVLGRTNSLDFPVSRPPAQGDTGSSDLFLLKLNPQGSEVVFSTFLGGTGSEDLFEISGDLAIGPDGSLYVTSDTASNDFPTLHPLQASLAGTLDAVVARFDAAGLLLFSTYLGGERGETGLALAVDGNGDVYVAGATQSVGFPTRNPAQKEFAGGGFLGSDGFTAKLKADGSELLYSTYIGGRLDDVCFGVGVDGAGNAYVAGGTASPDFPTVKALQESFGGGSQFLIDGFVAQLNPGGDSFGYSTYLGGSGDDVAFDLVVDSSGKTAITGATSSADFPAKNAVQNFLHGGGYHGSDAFVTSISAGGNSLACSTFLGGSPQFSGGGGVDGVGDDAGISIALDSSGDMYVAGATSAANFPLAAPFQPVFGSSGPARADAFIARLNSECSEILFSSYLGGEREDIPFGLAVSPTGSLWVAGTTESIRFPSVHALEPTFQGGGRDGFLVRVAETKQLHFAQFGDGRSNDLSLSSLIGLFNLSSTSEAHVFLDLRNDEGKALTLDLNGEMVEGSTQATIPPDGLLTFETDGEGELQAGSVTVSTDGEISGVILFRGFGTAGVLANQRLRKFRAPMRTSPPMNSGVAFMSLSSENQTIDLQLRDAQGKVVAEAQLPLPAWGHTSKYVTDLNWNTPPDFSEFLGTLAATSNQDFAATVILVTSEGFATLPVLVSEEPERFFFAQFGDGRDGVNSLASEITLFNLSDGNPVSAGLLIENDQGGPLTVDLNGVEVQGFVQVEIPPGQIVTLSTDGEGPLQAGSVDVISDRQVSGGRLAGVLLFRGFGLAGVQADPGLRRFRTPVRKIGPVNSGIAVKNDFGEQDVLLELRNTVGSVVARSTVHLNSREHVSKFVDEFSWDSTVDFTDFTGSLTGTGSSDFAAMSILVTEGEFATFPVTALR